MTFFYRKRKEDKATSLRLQYVPIQKKEAACCNAIIARNGNIPNALALHIESTTMTTFAKFADRNVKRGCPSILRYVVAVAILTRQLGFA